MSNIERGQENHELPEETIIEAAWIEDIGLDFSRPEGQTLLDWQEELKKKLQGAGEAIDELKEDIQEVVGRQALFEMARGGEFFDEQDLLAYLTTHNVLTSYLEVNLPDCFADWRQSIVEFIDLHGLQAQWVTRYYGQEKRYALAITEGLITQGLTSLEQEIEERGITNIPFPDEIQLPKPHNE